MIRRSKKLLAKKKGMHFEPSRQRNNCIKTWIIPIGDVLISEGLSAMLAVVDYKDGHRFPSSLHPSPYICDVKTSSHKELEYISLPLESGWAM